MNKGQQFWLDIWREGRTYFHREGIHPDIITYWPKLQLPPQSKILVPLCGKSIDMVWLIQQGHQVTGIELSEEAIKQFATEQNISLQKDELVNAKHYFNDNISLWVADIFSLDMALIPKVDAIYDRAALIALPETLRQAYVTRCLQWLNPHGYILLKTMDYPQEDMEGPPFSVSDDEVKRLYQECQSIELLSCTERINDPNDHLVARGLKRVFDKVWLIKYHWQPLT